MRRLARSFPHRFDLALGPAAPAPPPAGAGGGARRRSCGVAVMARRAATPRTPPPPGANAVPVLVATARPRSRATGSTPATRGSTAAARAAGARRRARRRVPDDAGSPSPSSPARSSREERLAPEGLSAVAARLPRRARRAMAIPVEPGTGARARARRPRRRAGRARRREAAGDGPPGFALATDVLVVDVGDAAVTIAVPADTAPRLAVALRRRRRHPRRSTDRRSADGVEHEQQRRRGRSGRSRTA